MTHRAVRLALVSACLAVLPARADERPTLKEALALQEAMEQAVERAEPAVVCVLVSRSDVYQKWFGEAPHRDQPGRLGGFDPANVRLHIPADELEGQAGLDARLTWLRRHAKLPPTVRQQPDARNEVSLLETALKQHYDLGDRNNIPQAYGSGVVIDASGLVLTCYHVVRGATKVFVRLPGGKGSYADIYAADPRSDLAVLRLLHPGPAPLKTVTFGDGGKVRKGQWVLALANPYAAGFRDGSPSASWGIISNLRRRAPGRPRKHESDRVLHEYGTLIQTDARLTLGCSGGALINLHGEMIGITTALAALPGTERAGGYAVPIDDRMKRIIAVLRRGEEVEYGFLGVSSSEVVGGEGVHIDHVVLGSPAARAGLRSGDHVLKIDGTPVHETEDMFLTIGGSLAGSEIEIEVSGQPRPLRIRLVKLRVETEGIATNRPEPFRGLRVDYTSVAYQRRNGFELHFNPTIEPGVAVREVVPNSPAATAGLRPDDIITAVNGRLIADPADFYQAVRNARGPVELMLAEFGPDRMPRKVRLE
jgi:S1-C subfamily serine protease